jgi:hypothetical protein
MCHTTVSISLIARSALNVVCAQGCRAAILGVLLLAASIPAGSLAAVAVTSGGSGQPDSSVRPGRGPRAANAATGRDLVLQVRGSS